METLV